MAVDGRLNFDTKIDTKGFNQGTRTISNGLGTVKSSLGKVAAAAAAAFSAKQLIDFGKESVTTANKTSNAWQGLQSIIEGQGRSFSKANSFIQKYVSDGLVPLENAVTAYKNLAARGYDDSQIQSVMTALKDSAAFGRQASYSLGDAVTTATEGLKNENSILVDNAGVTKNVAKMWEDYAKSIGTSASNLTQEQKIQAEVNGIMTETRFQTGDAAKVAGTFSGQLSRLSYNFTSLKTAVGSILTAVLKPFVAYINVAITKVTDLVNRAAKALGVTDNISGSSSAIADGASEAASSYEDLAESAEQAKEATENSLAGFDKVTKLNSKDDDKSSTATTPTTSLSGGKISTKVDVDTSPAEKKITAFLKVIKGQFDKLKKWAHKMFDPFKKAWENKGKGLIESIKNAFKNIKNLLSEIGKSFETVWTNGTGQKTVEHILSIFRGINDIIGIIAGKFATAWGDGTGTAIVQDLLDIFNIILQTLDNIIDDTKQWAQDIDFSPLLTSVANLTSAIKPFAEKVGEGLEWFWNNVLLPMADWTIEELIPDFINLLAAAIAAVDTALTDAKPTLEWVWNNIIKPLAEKIGDIVIDVIKGLTEKLTDFSEWAKDNTVAMSLISAVILGFLAGLVFYHTTKKIVDIVTNIKDSLKKLGEISETTSGKIGLLAVAFGILVVGISTVAQNWNKMNTMEQATTILTSLAAAAAAAAVAIAIFHTSWSMGVAAASIVGGLTALGLSMGFATDLIGIDGTDNSWKNKGGSGTFYNQNGDAFPTSDEIGKGRSEKEIADMWADQLKGGSSSGSKNSKNQNKKDTKKSEINTDDYLKQATDFYNQYDFDKEFKLPQFATGTVVPANYGNFLAVLGDNKREPEVVSPLSTMEQAMANVLSKHQGNGSGTIVVELNIDGRKMHSVVVDANNAEIRKKGVNPLAPVSTT